LGLINVKRTLFFCDPHYYFLFNWSVLIQSGLFWYVLVQTFDQNFLRLFESQKQAYHALRFPKSPICKNKAIPVWIDARPLDVLLSLEYILVLAHKLRFGAILFYLPQRDSITNSNDKRNPKFSSLSRVCVSTISYCISMCDGLCTVLMIQNSPTLLWQHTQ
jgi:hypothetical protein